MLDRDIDPDDEDLCPKWEDCECTCANLDECVIILDAKERELDDKIYEIQHPQNCEE
jgi:hypothetical protein